jgi:polysaccharide chain length determinant protein (PEP-CTERM system associated)
MATNLSDNLRLLAREAYDRRTWVVGAFAIIAVLTTLIGMNWPKKYTSYSTVYVEGQSVIAPLLAGAAVPSTLDDRALIAREVIYGRKLLNQVVKAGGWKVRANDPAQIDGVIEGIKKRTLVENVGENLVRIEYNDTDAARAQIVAQKMAELFISESLGAKSRESQSAFNFIDQQVQEYQTKLRKLDEGLKNFRTSNADAQPGAEVDATHRITELKDRLVQLDQDLREAEIRKGSLQGQLSGEVDASTLVSRTEGFRQRAAELRSQLDNLRLTYHDTYPDVVQLKDQIRELEAAAAAEEKRRKSGAGADANSTPLDESLIANPVYQELRRGLYESNTTVKTVGSRIAETRRLLQQEEARSRRIQAAGAQLAELTRDYEVNTQLYQDLLRRREAARVSMNLDRTQEGVTMRVEEPAFLPHTAVGPSPSLFLFGGVLLGVLLPLGTLFTIQQMDPRIRHSSAISERLGLAVLGVVPHLQTPREGTAEARGVFSLGLVVLGTLTAVAALSAMRMTGAF